MRRYLTILFSAQAACVIVPPCEPSPSKALCIDGAPQYKASEQEAYVHLFSKIVHEEGYTDSPEDLAETIEGIYVKWNPADGFDCGGVESVGCYDGVGIEVTEEGCLGESALAHELIHVYLHRKGIDRGDGDHVRPIWNTMAIEPLLRNFCGDKYRHTVFGPIGGI